MIFQGEVQSYLTTNIQKLQLLALWLTDILMPEGPIIVDIFVEDIKGWAMYKLVTLILLKKPV